MTLAVLAADLTGDSTLALAAVTVVLAGVAIYGTRLTRRALSAANQDVQEAIKARIDQQAPRVVIVAEQVGPPTLFWSADKPEVGVMTHGQSFISGDQIIGLTGWFRLENEGNSTAIVRLPPNVLVRSHGDSMPSLSSGVIEPRPSKPASVAVGANFGQKLFIYVWRTFDEWKAQAEQPEDRRTPLKVVIKVDDTFKEGISDTTEIGFVGVPIFRSNTGEWVGGIEKVPELIVGKTDRTYPGLSAR